MAINWDEPEPINLRQEITKALHKAANAYTDALLYQEHRLAALHFDAIGRGDTEAAAALLAERIALGFVVE